MTRSASVNFPLGPPHLSLPLTVPTRRGRAVDGGGSAGSDWRGESMGAGSHQRDEFRLESKNNNSTALV